jgi:hypothetical protein
MKPFDIFIFSLSCGDRDKNRTVLIYALNDKIVKIYPITTQYENKSEAIKAKYFKINDWLQAGLNKQSYIDTGTRLKQPLSMFNNADPIGELTESDKQRLIKFIKK